MQVIKEFIGENKKKILFIIVIIIILIILFVILNNNDRDKIYRLEAFVFDKEVYKHDNGLISKLPYVNINGADVSIINAELIKKFYVVTIVNDRVMTYKFYQNDDITSLIVKIYNREAPESYPSEVLIYNVNSKTGVLIKDNQLLEMFGISFADSDEAIKGQLEEYYKYEIKNKYISNTCDFECYLLKTMSMPFDNCSYYIKDNTLFAYKNIIIGNKFFYDTNSGFDLFNFKIKEK